MKRGWSSGNRKLDGFLAKDLRVSPYRTGLILRFALDATQRAGARHQNRQKPA
jgi:hypothetical protein